MSEEDPVARLRRTIEADLALARLAMTRYLGLPWPPLEQPFVFRGAPLDVAPALDLIRAHGPQDTIVRCEAELAILDEHYILTRGDRNPGYEEFSVVRIGGADKDSGCVTCHYYGQGGVKGYGICRTVRLLAGGYRHRPGYEKWAAATTAG